MKQLFHGRSLYIGIAAIVIIVVLLMVHGVGNKSGDNEITTIVETGPVRQLVSVSGVAEAEQTAELAFPVTGIVQSVVVEKGSVVEAGDVLIELDKRALLADRQDAAAALAKVIADRDELLAGPQQEDRVVTSETVTRAREVLEQTIQTEERKVENARRALLSSGLFAFSNDADEEAPAPIISGTYICSGEGSYTIDVFSSEARSGYSYRLSGLEFGTFAASTEQALALGECGLRVQFTNGANYNRSVWTIEIPNIKSTSYTANLNAYNLAKTQAESAIALAEQDVILAEANATSANAPARSEAVTRANANIAQAQARLAVIDAALADRTLTAPFAGTITEIDILPGETVTTVPIVTLLASEEFEMTARVPEIDIGKLLIGQEAELIFDARSSERLTGTIDFISLKATEIDGVAYYESRIVLDNLPPWLRSGLNADIDIVIAETESNVLRVPKRFVSTVANGHEVIRKIGDETASTTVEITLEGNDGFVAITGLNEGDILVAP